MGDKALRPETAAMPRILAIIAGCVGVFAGSLAIADPSATDPTPLSADQPQPAAAAQPADDAVLIAAREKVAAQSEPADEYDRKDQEALRSFYAARHGEALWVNASGLKTDAAPLRREIENAWAYALDVGVFKLPPLTDGRLQASDTDGLANAEIAYSRAALLYARHARGGRIPDPTDMLDSNLDRRPQWIEPKVVMEALAATHEPDAYLRSLEPQHEQFEKLRQLYLAALPKNGGKAPKSALAKRLRANMEMWRWMWLDMGNFYVLNNIPEFMQYVYKDGKIIRSAKIVAGMLDKQTTIFSRPLKYVVLRPMWRVPESIKVKELWPSLLRGGGLMRQFGLQIETKDGKKLNWRTINWSKTDIRDYDVTQPPGPRSVLGHVKFSFPSQHTIFMHDTPDKWMFRSARRTLSHGCLRVQRPMQLAEMVLKEDKGWDAGKIAELDRSGPLNNEIAIDKEIPIHIVYFTAWVDEKGKLKTFSDVYGHEKRVTQALDGDWDRIRKGRDHLAPVEPDFDRRSASRSRSSDDYADDASPMASYRPSKSRPQSEDGIIDNLLGGI